MYDSMSLSYSWNEKCFKVIEKIIIIHILCSVTFFRKLCLFRDNVEKYGKARQATDDHIIRRRKDAICMPDS
jgi:hypothetical protein